MNTFFIINIPTSMIIVLMKKMVVKTRSVRVYIPYINLSLLFRMLLLIPADAIINSSGN